MGRKWEDLVVKAHVPNVSLKSQITAYVPSSVKDLIREKKVQDAHVVAGDFWVTNQAPLDQPQKKEVRSLTHPQNCAVG